MNIVRNAIIRVGAETGLSPSDIASKTRFGTHAVARARWLVWKYLRGLGWSYPRIARPFGCNHTSIMHGLRRLDDFARADERWAALLGGERTQAFA